MKNLSKILGIIALCTVIGFTAVSCGEANPFEGTWTSTISSSGGTETTTLIIAESTWIMTFIWTDGTDTDTETYSGTYTYDNNTAFFSHTENGVTEIWTATVSGDTLTVVSDDDPRVFTRVK